MRVLLIEDSRRLQESIAEGLRRSGYAVDVTGDGRQGLIHAQTTEYDAIVLDLMLPGMDGLSVLETLRRKGRQTPVLILSAKDTVSDRVQGLRGGADDYLVKPFAFDELLARIQALTRRNQDQRNPRIMIDDVMIDTVSKRVMRDGAVIDLTRREYAVLEYLALHRGRPIPRLELEEHIYDERTRVLSNVIDSTVCSLRAKLDTAGHGSLIRTRRGIGYQIDAPGREKGNGR